MMRKLLFSFCLLCIGGWVNAQSVVTINAIQQPSGAACSDTSVYYGDTVIVRAKVVMNGALAQAAGGRNIWLQSGSGGAFSGLDVFGFTSTATTPDDILDLLQGDSVEVTGYIDEFNGESEIRPLSVEIKASGQTVTATVVPISDLNDAAQNNNITTGEQWEGVYVELQNVTVTAVTYFSSNTRVSFAVADGSGNIINVSDRFICGRLPALGGTFVPPNVGDVYCSLKGVLLHSKNNCAGFNGRGYELHPFNSADYVVCSAAPAIFNISRQNNSPVCNQDETITAEVTDDDGVMFANLHYAFGAATVNYDSVPMVMGGSTWSADIPGQAEGTFTKYYISAKDSAGNYSSIPNVGGNSDPKFFTFRCNGLTIYDLQYVPVTFNSNSSGYLDLDVTVTGVVTASAEPGNLGYVFIQQENQLDWAGIMCTGATSLSTLTVGQKVTVSGTVKESFGYTRLESVSSVQLAGTGTINAITLAPENFTAWGFATNEAYEGMLIRLDNPAGSLFVVDANADSPSNFAEYRVGSDQFDPAAGCRIIAGRQTTSAFSSLNFSWVNDSSWASVDGIMNVPVCVVTEGNSFDYITGIIYYSFSNMKLLPRNNADVVNPSNCPDLVSNQHAVETTHVVVYPNPATESVNVQYDSNSFPEGSALVLFDLMGRRISSTNLNVSGNRSTLNVSSMPVGTYVLAIVNAAGEPLFRTKVNVIK